MCSSDIFLGLIAILFPPIAVWVKRGLCNADSFINIALCCLGFVPGLLHAWYIIAKFPETDYDSIPQDGGERGTVTYVYSPNERASSERGRQSENRGYGTNERMLAPPPAQQQSGGMKGQQGVAREDAGQSSAEGVPPSYDQAVRGDHKVQT
ncbi:MAG: hypothetical protein M1830_001944 [Pleopsidium flavum]|nr:MAG: hypothetical protein M1830_001944 [Pleopsidium flavum]